MVTMVSARFLIKHQLIAECKTPQRAKNDECQMSNDEGMARLRFVTARQAKPECRKARLVVWSFGHSAFLPYSSFVLRHLLGGNQ
jgi:hypothetical protein